MKPIIAIVVSMLPFVELRAGIPLALASGFSPTQAFLFCVLANIFVILPVFLFLDYLHEKFLRVKIYKRIAEKFLSRIRKKASRVEKRTKAIGFLALACFVAIPLPITGAYTGTIIAWMLGLERKKSFAAIALGVVIAGIIVTLASLGIISFAKIF